MLCIFAICQKLLFKSIVNNQPDDFNCSVFSGRFVFIYFITHFRRKEGRKEGRGRKEGEEGRKGRGREEGRKGGGRREGRGEGGGREGEGWKKG